MQQGRGSSNKVIHIEVCENCKIHEWCTHHDEKKYLTNFENVKSAILSAVPGCEVVKNVDIIPKIGAFEVNHGAQCLFSKMKSGLWPSPPAIAQRVKSYFDDLDAGKDVSGYGKSPEKAYVPPKKKIDPHSSRFKSFMSASNSQATMPKTENHENDASKHEENHESQGHTGYHEEVESPAKKTSKNEEEAKSKSPLKKEPVETKPAENKEEETHKIAEHKSDASQHKVDEHKSDEYQEQESPTEHKKNEDEEDKAEEEGDKQEEADDGNKAEADQE